MAKELGAVSVLSSRNLQQTLKSLPSSIDLLLVEDVLDDNADFKGDDDIDQTKGQEGREDEDVEAKGEEVNDGIKEDDKLQYEEEEEGEEVEEEEDKEEEEDEEEEGPLFALYCGGETSVIAGLGQENGYYQVVQLSKSLTVKNKNLQLFLFSLSLALLLWHCRWQAT